MILSDCNNADIALVVDTSDSVRPVWNGTTGVTRFLQLFINQFNIGLDRTRISSQTFGNRARVNWILRRYGDKQSMIDAVLRQEFIGGRTFYDLAFREILAAQFTETSGDRPFSPNKVVLVTDGTESLESRFAVLQEARRIRDTGAEVYVIGYGPNVNREYLIEIAGAPSRVYLADSVPRLIETVGQAFATVCPQTLPPTPTPTPAPQTPGRLSPCRLATNIFSHHNNTLHDIHTIHTCSYRILSFSISCFSDHLHSIYVVYFQVTLSYLQTSSYQLFHFLKPKHL